ncbi:MAG: PD40 domain-containing protein, partial [Burkholderiales bacterium]|nr:PD40 domain-containing protein [Burkholderiales bacterium]
MNRTPPAYLRQPTISGDTLVFVSDDDLWRVDAGGGVARRLGNGLSEPSTPCLSPDGAWIAYAGRDEQHSEVWLMPAGGGAARRLTWLGSELAVRGWSADGRILFCGNHGQPFLRNWHAYTVAAGGGAPERIPLGQVNHLAWGPQGRIAIGRNTIDPARWKRYRGGTAGHLWVEDVDATGAGSGRYTRLEGLRGNLSCPMWIGARLYFIGDDEGIGNLYSCAADGRALRRHSDHAEHYARHASSDGRRIVYQCGAEIWIHDPACERTQRVEIEVAGARTQAARRQVAAAEHLQGATLHPAGHSLALEVRGQLHTMAFWEGAPRRHGDGAGRRRLGAWLADGATLVCASDAGGEEAIEVHRDAGSRRLPWSAAEVGRVIALAAAPCGARIAFTNHRHELWLGDVDDATLRRLDRSDCARITDLAWSPCGGWLAYGYATSPRHTAIKLCEVASGTATLATAPEFRDYAPAFDPEGKYLYFLSLRTFDPVYDSVQFELSFPRAARPYLVALQAGGAAPFEPAAGGVAESRAAERR